MKKTFLYILFPILILNTSYAEIFKIPKLVSHFYQHHNLDQQVGVLTFLSMHYFGNDIDDDDESEDMELPFKKITAQGHISHAVHFVGTVQLKQHSFSVRKGSFIPQRQLLPSPESVAFFRPPKA